MSEIKDLQIGSVIRVQSLKGAESARTSLSYYHDYLFPLNTPVLICGIDSKNGKLLVAYNGNSALASVIVPEQFTIEPSALATAWLDSRHSGGLPKAALALGGQANVAQYGSDPEVFAIDEQGVVIPAWKYLPSKEEAVPLDAPSFDGYTKSRRVASEHWDGFQGEFQISPTHCHAFLVDNIQAGLKQVLNAARKVDPKASLVPDCVVKIPFDMMQEASEQHATLGCAPSLNAYPDEEPLLLADPRQLAIRFAGCHQHFGGYLGSFQVDYTAIVRALDAIFSVASVSLLQGLEDPLRRQFYGKAGEYRLPPHGLEYRTPSSAVLCHPVVTHLCFDLARAAVSLGLNGLADKWLTSEAETRLIINNLDVVGAQEVLARNTSMLTTIIEALYPTQDSRTFAKRALTEGAKDLLETADMNAVWHLSSNAWKKHCNVQNCTVQSAVPKSVINKETANVRAAQG